MKNLIQRVTREDLEIFEEAVKKAIRREPFGVDFSFVGIFGSAADASKESYHDIDFATSPIPYELPIKKVVVGQAIYENTCLLYGINHELKPMGRTLAVANNWSNQEDTYELVSQNVKNGLKIIPVHNFIFLDQINTLALPEKGFAKDTIRTAKILYGDPYDFFEHPIKSTEELELYQLMFKSNLACQVNLPDDFAYRKLKSKLTYFSKRYDNGLTVAEVEAARDLESARDLLFKSFKYMDQNTTI